MHPYPRSPFSLFATWIAHAARHPLAFVFAAVTIGVWLISGPLFGFSDTWQLVINTGTHHRHVPDGVSDSEHAEPG
jgi:low affinity Fe/Cu permease